MSDAGSDGDIEADELGDYEDIGNIDIEDDAPPGPRLPDADNASDESDGGDEADDAVEPLEVTRQPRQPLDPLRASNRATTVHIVRPEDRTTDHRLHITEIAQAIANRAAEIAKNSTHFAGAAADGLHDPVAIAYCEILARRCPYILQRIVGYTDADEPIAEEWSVNEMTLPPISEPEELKAAAAALAKKRE